MVQNGYGWGMSRLLNNDEGRRIKDNGSNGIHQVLSNLDFRTQYGVERNATI